MSNCTFQAQLVSIMEILAKAAVAEINRRVNDSCAVIRLEMRRSQRDIDALKRKYHVMDNELRRTRGRARKKGKDLTIAYNSRGYTCQVMHNRIILHWPFLVFFRTYLLKHKRAVDLPSWKYRLCKPQCNHNRNTPSLLRLQPFFFAISTDLALGLYTKDIVCQL